MGSFATNYEEIAAVLLFVIGMSNLVFQPNLLKKIIGLDIMDSAVYLSLQPKAILKDEQRQSLLMVFWMPVIISTLFQQVWYLQELLYLSVSVR